MKISIIGDGGWGTAIGILLTKKGHQVTIWGAFGDYVDTLKKTGENIKFLPGIKLPHKLLFTSSMSEALENSDLVVLAVPSGFIVSVLKIIEKHPVAKIDFLSVIKGIDIKTNSRMSEVIKAKLKIKNLAVLSGPNIAREVALGVPTASVCAASSKRLSQKVQDVFMCENFRVYTHNDIVGVEMGGALKNIIAVACGISDGLGFGTNTKAALMTRGLMEINKLGLAMGARRVTFSGLSGIGDLVTTCLSRNSRNRWLGEELGKGNSIEKILAKTEMVVEGVTTTKAVMKLAKIYKVDMPITQEVNKVLFKGKKPQAAVRSLMMRDKKKEI